MPVLSFKGLSCVFFRSRMHWQTADRCLHSPHICTISAWCWLVLFLKNRIQEGEKFILLKTHLKASESLHWSKFLR